MAQSKPRERALITGASSGIGAELARVFAANGHALVLVARTEAKLTALAEDLRGKHGVAVDVVPADLARDGAPRDVFRTVEERGLPVDILVNNAGVMPMGAFADTDTDALVGMAHLNVVGLTALSSLFLKPMVSRGKGRILNVASLASFQPLPSLAAYAASKAYVLSLTEALAEELRGTGVTATALCPGFTDTAMVENARRKNAALRSIPSAMMADAHSVAAEGYRACMEGQAVRVPGTALSLATGLIQAQRSITRTITGLFGRQAL